MVRSLFYIKKRSPLRKIWKIPWENLRAYTSEREREGGRKAHHVQSFWCETEWVFCTQLSMPLICRPLSNMMQTGSDKNVGFLCRASQNAYWENMETSTN